MDYAALKKTFRESEGAMPSLEREILCNRSFSDMATEDECNAYVARAFELAGSGLDDEALIELRSKSADALKRLAAQLFAAQPPATVRRVNMPVWNCWVDILPEQAAQIHRDVDLLQREYSACKAVLAYRNLAENQ